MATYELNNHAAFSGHGLKANTLYKQARQYIAHLFAISEERRAYRNTLHELEVLSDRELNDIGISRGDICQIAREAAELKRAHR